MDRDAAKWLALACLLAIAGALAVFLASCSLGPAVACPPGTYPLRVSATRQLASSGRATVNVLAQNGAAAGSYSGTGRTGWACERLCPPGTALELHESAQGRRVRCVDLYDRPDGGPRGDSK